MTKVVDDSSLQRRNFLKFFPRTSLIPIGEKLLLVKRCPLDHKTCHAGRQSAGKYGQSTNIDQRKITAVFRMKVRRIVIIEKHFDDDAEEAANLRHGWNGRAEQEKYLRVSCLLP